MSNYRKRSRLRKFLEFLLAAIVLTGVGIGISTPLSRSVQAKAGQKLATILPASIRPHTLVTINSQFPGKVESIEVRAGTKVKAGDLLARVVNPEFELEYQRAKTHFEALEQRQAASADSDAGNRNGESEYENAERALNAAKERLAMVSLDEVEIAYEKAASRLKQVQELADRQLATDAELEDAVKARDAELRNLRAEREHQSRLKEEVESAQERVKRAANTGPSQTDAINLRIELREASEALRIASERRNSQKIVSTVSGTVLRIMMNPGDEIPSGVPILQIAGLDQLDFDVPVAAELARTLRAGDRVNVRVPTEPPKLIAASISAIMLIPAQEESGYMVRITVENPSPSTVLAGLTGEVEFPHSEKLWRVFPF